MKISNGLSLLAALWRHEIAATTVVKQDNDATFAHFHSWLDEIVSARPDDWTKIRLTICSTGRDFVEFVIIGGVVPLAARAEVPPASGI